MVLPAGIETVEIRGDLYNPDGTPATGSVDFTPSVRTLHVGEKVIILPARITVPVVAGVFPEGFALPANDDPGGNPPAGSTYRVVERITGGSSYDVEVLAANGAVQDLSALAPVASSTGTPVVVGPAGPAMTDAALAVAVATGATKTALGATYLPGDGTAFTIPDQPTGEWGVELIDTAANLGGIMHIDHDGRGGTGSYGIDIRNRLGAGTALVIHQYGPAQSMRIDNTDNAPSIYVKNTENTNFNPTGIGSGDAFYFDDHGVARYRITGKGEVVITPSATATTHGLEIIGSTTAARKLARFSHNGPANGVEIISAGAAAGFYGLSMTCLDYGIKILTTTNNGHGLLIQKDSTGTGLGLKVTNKGTGRTAEFATAAASVAGINADGEYEHLTAGKGILLRSPDGTRYRLAVANGGAVAAVAA